MRGVTSQAVWPQLRPRPCSLSQVCREASLGRCEDERMKREPAQPAVLPLRGARASGFYEDPLTACAQTVVAEVGRPR